MNECVRRHLFLLHPPYVILWIAHLSFVSIEIRCFATIHIMAASIWITMLWWSIDGTQLISRNFNYKMHLQYSSSLAAFTRWENRKSCDCGHNHCAIVHSTRMKWNQFRWANIVANLKRVSMHATMPVQLRSVHANSLDRSTIHNSPTCTKYKLNVYFSCL